MEEDKKRKKRSTESNFSLSMPMHAIRVYTPLNMPLVLLWDDNTVIIALIINS